jgi:hypothetical protein
MAVLSVHLYRMKTRGEKTEEDIERKWEEDKGEGAQQRRRKDMGKGERRREYEIIKTKRRIKVKSWEM